jgi:hypothetical protein
MLRALAPKHHNDFHRPPQCLSDREHLYFLASITHDVGVMPTLFTNPTQDREYAYNFLNLPTEGRLATIFIAIGVFACPVLLLYIASVVVRLLWDFVVERMCSRRGKKRYD